MSGDLEPAYRALKEALDRARRVVLASHVRLDGDSLGTELAVYGHLKRKGLDVRIVNDTAAPDVFRHLPNFEAARVFPEGFDPPPDLVVVVDCPNFARIGRVAEAVRGRIPVAAIDHHVSNERFAAVNLLDLEACSSAEAFWKWMRWAGEPLDRAIAEALWVGLVTDTGRFLHTNTTVEALEMGAALVRAGVDPGEQGNRLYRSFTLPHLRLQALATAGIRVHLGGRLAILRVTPEMEREAGAAYEEVPDLVEIPRSIRGVEVAAALSADRANGGTRASLRSNRVFDVNRLAKGFGGGGHARAAGCTIPAPMDPAEEALVRAIGAAGVL